MLTFALVPQTRLVTGFQSTVNPTEKPSPQTPKPINHPLTADTFTPSAVKSRAGGKSPKEALAAVEQAFEQAGFSDQIKRETHSARQDIANFVYGKSTDGDPLDWIQHLNQINNGDIPIEFKEALTELKEMLS
jgi:hypothetical protein